MGKEVIYCEWCGEFPYYISIYDEGVETLICKRCYEAIENENYLNPECLDN